MLSPTKARRALVRKTKGKPGVVYYAIGVEVPPRRGAVFSMRHTEVPNARAGAQLLREKLRRKKVGMVGELIIASDSHNHTISLGGYIRRKNGHLEHFDGDIDRSALARGVRP